MERDFFQIIDYHGNFVGDIEKFLAATGIKDSGFNYSVVTVLGCQSSGKSTLLNKLFSTKFQVMNAAVGRQQTTKGLWLANDMKTSGRKTMVIDVEGTDSKERGEDRLTFEHRTALFSLALADCVIVNMWYHDIGRYTASNYGLLKTVLAVNLELFAQQTESCKTTLLFVIRDHAEAQTPLTMLERLILEDVRHIWQEIRKPPRFESSTADMFFDFKVCGLPSKFAQPLEFDAAADGLANRLQIDILPESYSRHVPSDGFAFYCRNVWDTIVSSSELDIPSQKEMLASYRCEEIKNGVLAGCAEVLKQKMGEADEGEVADLPKWTTEVVTSCIGEYSEPASRYQESVFLKKRDQLVESLMTEVQKVVDAHLGHVRARILREAKADLETRTASPPGDEEAAMAVWEAFDSTSASWQEETLGVFDKSAQDLSVDLPTLGRRSFNVSAARGMLADSLTQLSSVTSRDLSLACRQRLKAWVSRELATLDLLLSDNKTTRQAFWKGAADTALQAARSAALALEAAWRGLGLEGEGLAEAALEEAVGQTRGKVERIVDFLDVKLVQRFNAKFQADDEGAPRHWPSMKPEAIQKAFIDAKGRAMELLDVFTSFEKSAAATLREASRSPEHLDKALDKPLLDPARRRVIEDQATSAMEKACREALVIQATGGANTKIPLWMIGALVVLGWNEAMALLSSPLTMLLVLAAVLFVGVSVATGNNQLPMIVAQKGLVFVTTALLPLLHGLHQSLNQAGGPTVESSGDAPRTPTPRPAAAKPAAAKKDD